jgi:hypothetical protein
VAAVVEGVFRGDDTLSLHTLSNGRVPNGHVRRNSTADTGPRPHGYSWDERLRSRLSVWEYRLAGEGELAKQTGRGKLHFG